LPAWRASGEGIEIAVRVTPRASRNVLAAGTDAHFAARLAAPPVDGAANAALVALLTDSFGVPRRSVRLIAGETARLKCVAIAGDIAALEKSARSLYGERNDG
jgi:uncharacterized protein